MVVVVRFDDLHLRAERGVVKFGILGRDVVGLAGVGRAVAVALLGHGVVLVLVAFG